MLLANQADIIPGRRESTLLKRLLERTRDPSRHSSSLLLLGSNSTSGLAHEDTTLQDILFQAWSPRLSFLWSPEGGYLLDLTLAEPLLSAKHGRCGAYVRAQCPFLTEEARHGRVWEGHRHVGHDTVSRGSHPAGQSDPWPLLTLLFPPSQFAVTGCLTGTSRDDKCRVSRRETSARLETVCCS